MLIINSVDEIPIRLTAERWQHIIKRHPEMTTEEDKILQTVCSPDTIQEGDYGTKIAIKHYPRTPLTSKHLAVIYKEVSKEDGFVLTAYFTSTPSKRRKIIWKQ